MDFTALATAPVLITFFLYLGICATCWWLLMHKRYVILLLWPVVIYFPGPAFTSFLDGIPGLGQYVFPELTLFEMAVMLCYFIGLVVADRLLDLSPIIRKCLLNPTVRRLPTSPMFLPIFFGTALLASILQVEILRTYGTVLGGNYAYWESLRDQGSLWGFIAGLYEIVFICFVLSLLGRHLLGRRTRILITATYIVAAVLRLAGGTRLVLVNELAVVLLLLFLEGRIRKRQLVIVTAATVLGGGVIGLMRGGGGIDGGVLGPLYGIAIESTFNALSFNIACDLQVAGAIDTFRQIGKAVPYVFISAVPSFLRPAYGPAELDAMSPYNLGVSSGFVSTSSPVGGMSGFATVTYLTGHAMLGCWLLVIALAVLLRFTPKSRFKRLAVLVFALNAIHFWRDPVDISFKLLVQDLLVTALFLYIPDLSRGFQPRLADGTRVP